MGYPMRAIRYFRDQMFQSTTLHVLVVNPKGIDNNTLYQYEKRVSALVNGALVEKKDKRVGVITSAATDFRIYAKRGMFESWITDVVRRYKAFVLISPILGKASRDIVMLALQAKRPVRLLTDKGLIPITSLIEINKEDWTSGWRVKI